jgi:hypothetical protein
MAWSIISNYGDSSVAMHLFNRFFDNFAAAFRLREAVAGLIWRHIYDGNYGVVARHFVPGYGR